MTSPEEQLESLSHKIEQRELQTRRRVWLLSFVPLVFAGLFLVYTVWIIAKAEGRLKQTTMQLATVDTKMGILNTKVPEAQATLAAVKTAKAQLQTDFSQAQAALSQVQIDLATKTVELGLKEEIMNRSQFFEGTACIDEMVLKEYASDYTLQAQMFIFLLNMQQWGIPWNPDGFSETEGFDSPNFALYALQKNNLISSNYKPGTLPWNILPAISWPENGDIVYYKSGYTMFYFELPISYNNSTTRSCVIGMTPLGILVQKMEFAEWIGFLKVPYP